MKSNTQPRADICYVFPRTIISEPYDFLQSSHPEARTNHVALISCESMVVEPTQGSIALISNTFFENGGIFLIGIFLVPDYVGSYELLTIREICIQ